MAMSAWGEWWFCSVAMYSDNVPMQIEIAYLLLTWEWLE
jgi:hypothetical protein